MIPAAPVGAPKKSKLSLVLGVSVLAVGASGCGHAPIQENPDGGCQIGCNLYPAADDGGLLCLC